MPARAFPCLLLLVVSLVPAAGLCAPQAQKKEYLTASEADKIRDAETPSERIKLFVAFAADRLKKLQYELSRTGLDRGRADRLNALLNAYTGCVDGAAELIELGREKQQNVRDGIKELNAKGKEFLSYLEQLAGSAPEQASYKSSLEDAIEATKDALQEAEKAAKEIAPPPVRRRR